MSTPRISSGGSGLPSRVVFHGVEGIGKTSFAAFAPKPIFGMTRGETGLLTLIDNGRVTETDHFEEFGNWHELTTAVHYLLNNQTDNRTFVLDTLNGAERLCFESVCQDRYSGDWVAFDAYGRGPNVALAEWNEFLTLLDRLRQTRRMAIIALCHTKVKPYSNPLGENFDRFTPDMNDKTWGLAAKWADIILFGNFEIQVKKVDKMSKGKGTGGERRILYTTRTAAYDAKNRGGLPNQIPMGTRPEEAWKNFVDAIVKAKSNSVAPQQQPPPLRTKPEPTQNGSGHAPTDTANGNGKPVPSGVELEKRIADKDAALVAAGVCKPKEFLNAVSAAGEKKGWSWKIAEWPAGEGFTVAVEATKAFEAAHKKPQSGPATTAQHDDIDKLFDDLGMDEAAQNQYGREHKLALDGTLTEQQALGVIMDLQQRKRDAQKAAPATVPAGSDDPNEDTEF